MRRILAAAALAALAGPAIAETRAERLAMAQLYIEASLADIDMSQMVETMWRPIVRQIEASGQTVTNAQKAKIEALFLATYAEPMRNILRAQDEVMADLMTLEEITALRDFYATPVGRSVLTKLPQILEAQQPQIISLVQGTTPLVVGEVERILSE